MKKVISVLVISVLSLICISGCIGTYTDANRERLGRNLFEGALGTMVRRTVENEVDSRYEETSQGHRYYNGETSNAHYEGYISNATNEPDGKGTAWFTDGRVYSGNWVQAYPDGKGTFKYKDGRVYSGNFVKGVREGTGTTSFPNGMLHEGKFHEGTFIEGTRTYPNGIKKSGKFDAKGRLHGEGEKVFLNGIIRGKFIEGSIVSGTFTGNDGTIIKGDFGNSDNPQGKILYPDGRVYSGEWNGSCDEVGMECTKGHWTYEVPHGEGTLIYPDGRVEKGTWERGVLVE
jgi:hypothetical protein